MKFSGFDHECMALALRLAEKGLYTTHPNPRVGCVIADSEKVLATGWHRIAGEDHAEIVALKKAGPLAVGATAYVTLEPCAHQGRTPACTTALMEAGIARIIFAAEDPYPEVNGKGKAQLRSAGLSVQGGLMESQARTLNAGYFKRIIDGLPWVRIKSAQSLDGRTALANGDSQWITSEQSRADVQHWRARSDAILTGIGTVVADDPRLTVRSGVVKRQPLRVVVDSRFRINPDSQVLDPKQDALIVGCVPGRAMDRLAEQGVECLLVAGQQEGQAMRPDLELTLKALAGRGINEVQVEAGATLCGALLSEDLVDEILLYQAPKLLGIDGPPAFSIGPLESVEQGMHLELREAVRFGPDFRFRLTPKKRA
ncbi:MAG TPA: bifunctional diaminohydroxyphosphoribosylaminopyrimidine deaminase/5-amino-6-(5-phosphoribosylamino)uracil reductase RibD [Xanthomonadales bacterium]|nr:bifunctional diaminohydroxyphosphoribosylaminopyrimidine deaminase/5-amino-6-(5-phosphoribosylamino)uracil reductase RibD [Xanthomonadales bacterium]